MTVVHPRNDHQLHDTDLVRAVYLIRLRRAIRMLSICERFESHESQ